MVVYDTRYPLLPNSRPLLLSSQRSQDRKSQLLFPGGGLRRKWLPPYLKLPASIIWCSNRAGPGHENQMAQAGTRRKAKARSHGKSRKRWPTPESSRRGPKIQGNNQRSRRLGRTCGRLDPAGGRTTATSPRSQREDSSEEIRSRRVCADHGRSTAPSPVRASKRKSAREFKWSKLVGPGVNGAVHTRFESLARWLL